MGNFPSSLPPLKYFLRHFPRESRLGRAEVTDSRTPARVRQVSPLDTVKTLFETLSSACRSRPWNKRAKFWIFCFSAFPSAFGFVGPNATGPLYSSPIPLRQSSTLLRLLPSSTFQLPYDSNTKLAEEWIYVVANLLWGDVNDLPIERIKWETLAWNKVTPAWIASELFSRTVLLSMFWLLFFTYCNV